MPLEENDKIAILGVFCRNTLADVRGAKKGEFLRIMRVADRDELIRNGDFTCYYNLLTEICEDVEDLQASGSMTIMVKKALLLLSDKKAAGDVEAFLAAKVMISSKLMPGWNDDIRELYQTGVGMLEEWIHFFISYTNQSAPASIRLYRKIISNDLLYDEIKRDEQRINLIARLLYTYLRMERSTSFYDKEGIDWGEGFQKKIFDYTKSSYAFIQIVETKIFEQDPPNNYCYKEYDNYKRSIEAFCQDHGLAGISPQLLFLVSNPELTPRYRFEPAGDVGVPVVKWVEDIYATEYKTLHRKLSNSELKLMIQKAVLDCKAYRKTFFRNYVDAIN